MKVKDTEEKDDKVTTDSTPPKSTKASPKKMAEETDGGKDEAPEDGGEVKPEEKPNPLNPDKGMTFDEKALSAFPIYSALYVDVHGGVWATDGDGRRKLTRK